MKKPLHQGAGVSDYWVNKTCIEIIYGKYVGDDAASTLSPVTTAQLFHLVEAGIKNDMNV